MIKKLMIKLSVILFGIMTIVGSGHDDTTPPDAPLIFSIKLESGGRITVKGSAEVKSTVRVIFPDTSHKETTAASNESYSITSEQSQLGGNIVVTATDASGNKSVPTIKLYTPHSQGKTFQLNIQDIDIKKTDGSDLYPQGEEYLGTSVVVE